MSNRFSLSGKCALITGGSKGLGKQMAISLANAGADVLIVSRNSKEGERSAKEIMEKTGRKCFFSKCDVRKYNDVKKCVEKAIKKLGKIDILITSAGINFRHNAVDFPEEKFKDVIETNFFGTWYFCKQVGKHMIERKYGKIITLGSILSVVSLPERTAYASSKGAVLQLTKTLSLEWAKYNINVNCLCPGPFQTPMNEKIFKDKKIKKFFLEKIPLSRLGKVEEIGDIAVFLSSDASSFITGSAIFIDGGWTAI